MRIGSLFSGIGGLELGLERAGVGTVIWQVEIDAFCRRVLEKHWPNVARYENVCEVDGSTVAAVDVLCGGFPCQDVSSAGKRAGLEGARSGLWREYFRLVGELRPRAVVVENVTSGERAWLPRVQHDLVSLGYRTEALRLGAVDVGAPHRRTRTFVLAVRLPDGGGRPGEGRRAPPGERSAPALQPDHPAMGNAGAARRRGGNVGGREALAAAPRRGEGVGDPAGARLEERGALGGDGQPQDRAPAERSGVGDPDAPRQHQPSRREDRRRAKDASGGGRLADAERDPLRQQQGGRRRKGGAGAPEPPPAGLREAGGALALGSVGRGPDGLSRRLDAPHRWPASRGEEQHAWEPPRTARRGEIQENAARLKALGNAVVPQVAELVGRRLLQLLEA